MQTRDYVDLHLEDGTRFYYRNEALMPIKEEIEEFSPFISGMDNLVFAKKMMYSHELKANNQVEGYGDDLELIEAIIKRKIANIKDDAQKKRIVNLYKGYNYILAHRKFDKEHLKELYDILSSGLLDSYDINHMGKFYREAPVYILKNGRLDTELDEGVNFKVIDELIQEYFLFINEYPADDKIAEYIKSQIMHFYFVYVHPYFDVNGRTSRTMALWYLLRKQAYPFIIFNRGISFKGSSYDKVVRDSKVSHDMTYFLKMMLETLKTELEKEYIMEVVASNANGKFSGIDYQTILYFLTMNGLKTFGSFVKFYNSLNDTKKAQEIFLEMIEPLINMQVLEIVRYTNKEINGIRNMELKINESLVDIDPQILKRTIR